MQTFLLWALIIVVAFWLYVFPVGYAGFKMLERFGRGWEGCGNALAWGPVGLLLTWGRT